MRFSIVMLSMMLLASCAHQDRDASHFEFPPGTKGEGDLIRTESDKPYYADFWQHELAEHPHPKAALLLADAYFDSLPFARRPPHRDKVRVEYLHGFFEGITYAGATIYTSDDHDTFSHGLRDGVAYHHDHPDKFTETMEGFGYIPTESVGTWSYGLEWSGFRPHGASIEKTWWLSPLENATKGFPEDAKVPKGGFTVRIIGFLSPKGEYGHLGMYNHEFFATRVIRINRG